MKKPMKPPRILVATLAAFLGMDYRAFAPWVAPITCVLPQAAQGL
jgi:hypothetical protein